MIGERLAELRKEQDMSQKELSELLLVSVTTISGYENDHNNPDDDTKVQIAKFFNVSLDYLLGATDKRLLLDRESRINVIVFPKKIPPKVLIDVKEYAEFLSLKYKQII